MMILGTDCFSYVLQMRVLMCFFSTFLAEGFKAEFTLQNPSTIHEIHTKNLRLKGFGILSE